MILIFNGAPNPIGEVTQDEHGWSALHYASDQSYDCISDKDAAIDIVIDIEQENI